MINRIVICLTFIIISQIVISQRVIKKVQFDSVNIKDGTRIVSTNDGGVILFADYNLSTDDKSRSPVNISDLILVKYDSVLGVSWMKKIVTDSNDWAVNAIQTPDSGYVLLSHYRYLENGHQSLLLVRLDKNGEERWRKKVHEGPGNMLSMKDGFLLMSTQADKERRLLITKYSYQGDMLWERSYYKSLGNGSVLGHEYDFELNNLNDTSYYFYGNYYDQNAPEYDGKPVLLFPNLDNDFISRVTFLDTNFNEKSYIDIGKNKYLLNGTCFGKDTLCYISIQDGENAHDSVNHIVVNTSEMYLTIQKGHTVISHLLLFRMKNIGLWEYNDIFKVKNDLYTTYVYNDKFFLAKVNTKGKTKKEVELEDKDMNDCKSTVNMKNIMFIYGHGIHYNEEKGNRIEQYIYKVDLN